MKQKQTQGKGRKWRKNNASDEKEKTGKGIKRKGNGKK